MTHSVTISAIYVVNEQEIEISVTPTEEQDIIDAIIEEASNQDIELEESDIDLEDSDFQVTDWDLLANSPDDQQTLELVYKINDSFISDHIDIDIILSYADAVGIDYIEDVEEAYQGQYDSDEDFAQDMAEQTGSIDRNASWPQNCIDWEQAARELMYDYTEAGGYYFRQL